MAKVVDTNGYWEIKNNPISKVGVFPYMGRSISDECEPDKVYYVYRPATTLEQSVDTWDNPPKPFINDHEMLGEGFSKIDDRPVQGVIHNPHFEDGVLYADLSVYSESLKKKIEDGKKELSLGYFCKYRKEKGVYKGQAYDFVQEDMVGNHIALVDNGRCGSDVKVFDSKCTMDSLDITKDFEEENDLKKNNENGTITITETKDSKMKYISVDDVKTILDEALEEEKAKEVSEKVEAKASDEEEKEEEKKAEDKCGKDEESEKEEKKTEDSDEEEEKKETEDEEVSPANVMAFLKMILEEVRSINGKKTTDEEEKEEKAEDKEEEKKESEDEDEEKKSEDEDDDKKKKSEDSAIVVQFAKDGADTKPVSMMDDPALRKYLGL